jgi:N-acetylglucosamine kinase-like BadF-type ATPase
MAWEAARSVRVTTDLEIALVSAFGLHDPGMLLVAGTGSAAVARLAGGRLDRMGGLGWRLGDEGGGYAIGCAGLRAVGRAMDGRGTPTSLSQQIPLSLGLDGEKLVRWAGSARVREVAALAPIVVAAADHDPVACEIVSQAAEDLTAVVRALVNRTGEDLALALTGGLLHEETALRRELADRLGRNLPTLRITGTADPVAGALMMAHLAP